MKLIKIIILLLAIPLLTKSETLNGNFNSWFQVNTNFKLTDKISIFNEVHERTGSFFYDHAQFLIRPSIDYKATEFLTISVGYTFIDNDPFNPYPGQLSTLEHNIWEQLFFNYKEDNISFYNRLRLENRFQDRIISNNGNPEINGTNFVNRFRARIGVKYHIDKFYFHIFDEIFINQKDNLTITGFDRNWIYFGTGYNLSKDISLEIGIMDQFDKLSPANTNFIESPIMQLTIWKTFEF